MAVAKAVQKKMDPAERQKLLEAPALGEEQLGLVGNALADLTDATSWQQLWLDLGLVRETKPTGGARPREEGPEPTEADVERVRRQDALAAFEEPLEALHRALRVDGYQALLHAPELKAIAEKLYEIRMGVLDELKKAQKEFRA
jgi:hypothetical protein